MKPEHVRVRLEGSRAWVSVNGDGGCYIEFEVKGPAGSVAHTIAEEDLLPLIEALRTAARRSSVKIEE